MFYCNKKVIALKGENIVPCGIFINTKVDIEEKLMKNFHVRLWITQGK